MAGPKLEITFSSVAELEGAKAFAAELEKNIGKAKAMGKETGQLQAQLATLKQSIGASEEALRQGTQAEEKGATATKNLKEQKSALRDVVKGLAFELPGFARVLGFIANPMTLLSAGLGVAAGQLLKWKANADAVIAQRAEIATFAETLGTAAEKAGEFAKSAIKFETGLKQITSAGEGAAVKMGILITQIEKARVLADQLGDLQGELDIAGVKDQRAKGVIDDNDVAEQEHAIRMKVLREKQEREEAAIRAKMTQVTMAQRKAEREIETARGENPSNEALGDLELRKTTLDDRAKRSQEQYDEDSKALRKELGKLDAARKGLMSTSAGAAGASWPETPGTAHAVEMGKVLDELKRRKRENAAVKGEAKAATEELDLAKEARTESEKKVEAGVEEVAKRQKELEQLERELEVTRQFNARALKIQEAIGQKGVETQQFQSNKDKAEKEAQFYKRQQDAFEEMTPAQQREFLKKQEPKPTPRPTPRPYPRGRGTTSPTEVKQFDDRRERGRDVAGILPQGEAGADMAGVHEIVATGATLGSKVDRLADVTVAAMQNMDRRLDVAIQRINNARS